MTLDYFKNLFFIADYSDDYNSIPANFLAWDIEALSCLAQPLVAEEVKKALFDMSSYKAPGPDGF